MNHETITLDCEAFGFLDLDVSYEEVVEDNSFDHEFGTEKHTNSYAIVYAVKFNDQPIRLTSTQIKELESFINENIIETAGV
jgi:hypothetical protein